jgi:hypothetical protein
MDTIEKIMHTYGMMVNLSPQQHTDARERLVAFLANKQGNLTVQGLKFLRGDRVARTRRAQP